MPLNAVLQHGSEKSGCYNRSLPRGMAHTLEEAIDCQRLRHPVLLCELEDELGRH